MPLCSSCCAAPILFQPRGAWYRDRLTGVPRILAVAFGSKLGSGRAAASEKVTRLYNPGLRGMFDECADPWGCFRRREFQATTDMDDERGKVRQRVTLKVRAVAEAYEQSAGAMDVPAEPGAAPPHPRIPGIRCNVPRD
jgi:hypothetical protein